MKKGIVIKSTGSWYWVKSEEGSILSCRIQGKFRLGNLKLTNPVAVGDEVTFSLENKDEQLGVITAIRPRRNYVVRSSPHKAHYCHLLAANIDQAVLLVTLRQPNLKPGFIDRFLMMTEPFDIPTVIVVNKSDLYDTEDLEVFGGLEAVYGSMGYRLVLVSALTGAGIEELRALLKDKISLISGHSGVGKSTLANAIQPGLELRTKEISDYSGKGQHTTTFAEMHDLAFGGSAIDTPGIKSLTFNNIAPTDVAHNFREFFAASKDCKYTNCLHLNEPQCAVKKAIAEGRISEVRYKNYYQIMSEVMEQNDWQRVKNL